MGLDPALADEPRLIVFALNLILPDPSLYQRGVEVAIANYLLLHCRSLQRAGT